MAGWILEWYKFFKCFRNEAMISKRSIVVQIVLIKTLFLSLVWHELTRSIEENDRWKEIVELSERVGRMESRHSIKSLEGMRPRSYDLWAVLKMHSMTANCYTFSNEENVAEAVLLTFVEDKVTDFDAMLDLCFRTSLLLCLKIRLRRLALG